VFKAQQTNTLIYIESAEKGLQFGVTKCKRMLVGKYVDNVLNSHHTVDMWRGEHKDGEAEKKI
jgi:hypothetical protein